MEKKDMLEKDFLFFDCRGVVSNENKESVIGCKSLYDDFARLKLKKSIFDIESLTNEEKKKYIGIAMKVIFLRKVYNGKSGSIK